MISYYTFLIYVYTSKYNLFLRITVKLVQEEEKMRLDIAVLELIGLLKEENVDTYALMPPQRPSTSYC